MSCTRENKILAVWIRGSWGEAWTCQASLEGRCTLVQRCYACAMLVAMLVLSTQDICCFCCASVACEAELLQASWPEP
jgi:hypothetical protein